jgi:hypothetical protein
VDNVPRGARQGRGQAGSALEIVVGELKVSEN